MSTNPQPLSVSAVSACQSRGEDRQRLELRTDVPQRARQLGGGGQKKCEGNPSFRIGLRFSSVSPVRGGISLLVTQYVGLILCLCAWALVFGDYA